MSFYTRDVHQTVRHFDQVVTSHKKALCCTITNNAGTNKAARQCTTIARQTIIMIHARAHTHTHVHTHTHTHTHVHTHTHTHTHSLLDILPGLLGGWSGASGPPLSGLHVVQLLLDGRHIRLSSTLLFLRLLQVPSHLLQFLQQLQREMQYLVGGREMQYLLVGERMKNSTNHSPIHLRWQACGPSLYVLPYLVIMSESEGARQVHNKQTKQHQPGQHLFQRKKELPWVACTYIQ